MNNLKFIWILTVYMAFSLPVAAQKTSDKTSMENERQQIQKELQQIEQAYNTVKGMSNENLSQLAALNRKIELQEKYINNIGKEIRLLDDDIYYSAIEIKRLKGQMDTLKSHYARTVVYAYKNRSSYDYLNFIFSANSFNDAVKRVAYLKSYRNYRQKQMGDILKTRDLIARRYEYQMALKGKKKGALETRSGEFEELGVQKVVKDSVARELGSQAGELQKQIAKKKQRDAQLRSSIASVVRKEIAEAREIARRDARAQSESDARARADALAKQQADMEARTLADIKAKQIDVPVNTPQPQSRTSGNTIKPTSIPKSTRVDAGLTTNTRNVFDNSNRSITAKSAPIVVNRSTAAAPPTPVSTNKPPAGGYLNYQAEDVALNADFSQNRGRLPHPVEGVITLGFGRYKIEGVGPDIVGDNPGVTFTANVGSPVRTVFGGEVVSVSNVGGMAFVVIRHGKYFTAYSNLGNVSISKGASVSRGQAIGTVGADEETGNGKLDFILMIEERNVDPRGWLR